MLATSAFEWSDFRALPDWSKNDPRPAFEAFRRSALRIAENKVEAGTLGFSPDDLRPAAAAALVTERPSAREAQDFFQRFFRPALIRPSGARGFLTGYYEPELEASRVRTDEFRVPLYGLPPDLEKVTDENRPAGFDPSLPFGRRLPDGRLVEYPDRAAIETGFLKGRNLELAWLRDPVDAFFIHVQGSARLRLPDKRVMRVGYAGKTGHPFTAIGRIMVAEGELTLEEADMTGLRRWLAAHPNRVEALLRRNRSFIFFREMPESDSRLGPVGAAALPLTPLASLAVDGRLHTYGTPIFAFAPTLQVGKGPFARLLIAQDTGSAIVGPARGDVFVGSGNEAGRVAGAIRHSADLYALLPQPRAEGEPR